MPTPLVFDPVVAEMTSGTERPDGWHQRWLYVGEEAADLWLAVGSKQNFRKPRGMMEDSIFGALRLRSRLLAEAVLRAVGAGAGFRTLVSLGPGDALLDRDIVRALSSAEPRPAYIPIDLSERLLRRVVERFSGDATVPCGILGDFESRFPFIERQVEAHCSEPRLYSLLGNTFGNLDEGERAFLRDIRRALHPGDGFLMSVSTQGPGWRADLDPQFGPSGYPQPVQRLIETKLGATPTVGPGVGGPGDPGGRFRTGVRFVTGDSDVPLASTVDLVDVVRDTKLLSVRRYDWPSLLAWLSGEMRFAIVFEEEVGFDEIEGAGVVLVRPS